VRQTPRGNEDGQSHPQSIRIDQGDAGLDDARLLHQPDAPPTGVARQPDPLAQRLYADAGVTLQFAQNSAVKLVNFQHIEVNIGKFP
jgi:hypothetical protein